MNFFRLFKQKHQGKTDVKYASVEAVRRRADQVLKEHEQTFIDLAKYDRGELTSNSLPQ
jgi:hypothetical protein